MTRQKWLDSRRINFRKQYFYIDVGGEFGAWESFPLAVNLCVVLLRQIFMEINLQGEYIKGTLWSVLDLKTGCRRGAVWREGAAHVRFPWGSDTADAYGKKSSGGGYLKGALWSSLNLTHSRNVKNIPMDASMQPPNPDFPWGAEKADYYGKKSERGVSNRRSLAGGSGTRQVSMGF